MAATIFLAGNANLDLARNIAEQLGQPISDALVGRFPNGETRVRIDVPVAAAQVVIIQSIGEPVNDHLMELLLLADAAHRAGAVRITAVIPYCGYARQDRVSAPGEPVSISLLAQLLRAAHVDHAVTLDLHSEAATDHFVQAKIPLHHLSAIPVLAGAIQELDVDNLRVVAPDAGGIDRATRLAAVLTPGQPPILLAKERLDQTTVTMTAETVSVPDNVVIADDLIATGGTIAEAARLLTERGAQRIFVAATHGEFTGQAMEKLTDAPIEEVLVTNALVVPNARRLANLHEVDVSSLFAEALAPELSA